LLTLNENQPSKINEEIPRSSTCVCEFFILVIVTLFIYQEEIKINYTLILPNQQIVE